MNTPIDNEEVYIRMLISALRHSADNKSGTMVMVFQNGKAQGFEIDESQRIALGEELYRGEVVRRIDESRVALGGGVNEWTLM